MTFKRRLVSAFGKSELLAIGRELELEVTSRMTLGALQDAVAGSKRAKVDLIVTSALSRDALKAVCEACGLDPQGKEKQVLVDRILEAAGGLSAATEPAPEAAAPGPAAPDTEVGAQRWLAFPQLDLPEIAGSSTAAAVPRRKATVPPRVLQSSEPGREFDLTLEVQPRKPRLAWQGMSRKEVAISVPTQVVEIVRPGRAIERGDELALEARQVTARDVSTVPPNRLIWTNDNLVALQTLLDERDPETRDYRYRGKVDLVYIDPPFMVNSDFRADNSIDIELDDDEGVQATKEPSLVEILAYKDTWRQGLDSFLTMLRRRLELLKQLLAPTGSIYVHLDWHAVHYVKVLMDEMFGYELFQNEVIWKRTFARSDAKGFNQIHDTILGYGNSNLSYWNPVYGPHALEYIRSHYNQIDEKTGKRFQLTSLDSPNPRPNMMYEWKGYSSPAMGWRYSLETMRKLDQEGLIHYPPKGGRPRFRRFLDDDGVPIQSIWMDVSPVNSQSSDRSGYPTQKPVELISRIMEAAVPPNGLVLDCFGGSGTTAEAAERLGRKWILIDNSKYAVHLSRKRLIQLHGQPRPSVGARYDYSECASCSNVERKERSSKSPGPFHVRPFTVENMGVYQRAEQWQDFQTQRSRYRDEMIKVFGGEVLSHSPLLHGRKGNSWVHVGPLDGPISVGQVWNIAREAQRTSTRAVTILSADFDTLSGGEKDEIKAKTGVAVIVRVIPASAVDECRRRLELQRKGSDQPVESMAIPAFYAPLSIVLSAKTSGRGTQVKLDRCEVDIQSFLASQRPVIKPVSDGMAAPARKKVQGELDKWDAREKELSKWLAKATTWQKFIDYWAIDWDYGSRVSPDGKPIFETDWQSFRVRRGKAETDLTFVAEFKYDRPGQYRVAARVTDVFGNDGISTLAVEVR